VRPTSLTVSDRRVPSPDTCNNFVESISPTFDPCWVLLRHLYFINDDRTRYVSVWVYPARNYQPLVEFGASGNKPITLTEQHMATMALHLPQLCEAMCNDEHYRCLEGDFKMLATGGYKTARLYLGKRYSIYKLQDLRVLSNVSCDSKSADYLHFRYALCYGLFYYIINVDYLCWTYYRHVPTHKLSDSVRRTKKWTVMPPCCFSILPFYLSSI
jgi:hypothetical protein